MKWRALKAGNPSILPEFNRYLAFQRNVENSERVAISELRVLGGSLTC